MQPIIENVLSAVLSALIIGGGTLLIEPIRTFFRYRSHEYYLIHNSNDSRCTWDVQWEGERLTIDAANVHNDHLEGVVLRRNDAARGYDVGKWEVSDKYVSPERWPIQIKLAAIIRKKTGNERIYNVHFVIRRKRW